MSSQDAQEEAGKWIGKLHLGRNLDGKTIDLSAHGVALEFTGLFRKMIFKEAVTKLKRRGAREVILPPQ